MTDSRPEMVLAEPARWKAATFLVGLAAYYVVYGVDFGRRVAEYFSDLLIHFEFFRRMLGIH